MKKLIYTLFIFSGLAVLSSCVNETTSLNGNYSFKVRMTDAPGPYTKVNIDIRGLSILDGSGKTVNLLTNSRIYNLLALTNGADVLLSSSYLNDSEIKEIRLILGPNNSVVVNNIAYPLKMFLNDQLGLKILVNQNLHNDKINEILIDFDAHTSVVLMRDGTYKLKPVLRLIDKQVTGSISGIIPSTSIAVVTATSLSNITYSSGVNATGHFKVDGLPPGKFLVTIIPLLPATAISHADVTVQGASNTIVTAAALY